MPEIEQKMIENFDDFYRKYIKFSAKVAYKMLKNQENAEDISQEVFLHFYKIRKNIDYSNERKLESLVYTTTENKCKDYRKKSWNKREMCLVDADKGIEPVDEKQNPEKVILQREAEKSNNLSQVIARLREVNPTNYDILIKTKIEKVSTDTVAEEYGITRNNVNNRNKRSKDWIANALKELRRRL